MEQPLKDKIENFVRPRISVGDDEIYVRDKIIIEWIVMTLVGIGIGVFSYLTSEGMDQETGCFLGFFLALVFLNSSLSLKRVKIDFNEKVVYRTTLNPLENLLDRMLQHPKVIPFGNIAKVYADYTETFAPATQRYYVYVRTDDPYNLKIGTFKKLADAELFAEFVNSWIHSKRR